MPNDPELAPIADPRAPRLSRLRKRLALGTGFVFGAATVVGLVHALVLLHAAPPPPPPAAPIPIAAPAVAMPPPLVVTIEKTIEAPRAAVLDDDLGCALPTTPDLPIGAAVDTPTNSGESEKPARVMAASAGPQLAVLHEGTVWVSDDDGRSFRRAFEGHEVDHIAVDRYGVIYAQDSDKVGVRALDGRVIWRSLEFVTCAPSARCDRRIGTNGTELVGFIDDTVATSADQGKTWKIIPDPEYAWSDHRGELFSWQGSLYQVSHYHDMCGVNDTYVFRLDAGHRVAHDIFHDYYTGTAEPVLQPSSDVTQTWTWKEKCWNGSESLGRCPKKSAVQSQLLRASTLLPVEGGRTLSVYGGAVIELCPEGVRQIYRTFPLAKIDAVDPAGRILVMQDMTLLRWSPVHGWRKLKTFVDPVRPDAGSD
jgi:hypothetical protein